MVRHPKSVGWRYLPFHFFNPAIHSVQLCQLQSNSIVTQNYFIASVSLLLHFPGQLSPNTLSNFSAVFHHCLSVVSIVTKHSQIAKHVHVVVIFSPINFDLDIHILLLYMHLKCFRSVTIQYHVDHRGDGLSYFVQPHVSSHSFFLKLLQLDISSR